MDEKKYLFSQRLATTIYVIIICHSYVWIALQQKETYCILSSAFSLPIFNRYLLQC